MLEVCWISIYGDKLTISKSAVIGGAILGHGSGGIVLSRAA